jgi:DNA-binding NarL/FixJ family response regulator
MWAQLCAQSEQNTMTGNPMLHVELLTARERQMAHAVSRGLRNRQIANEFGISEETVKKHLATIYGKLAIPGRVALAVHVLQTANRGIVAPPAASLQVSNGL